MISFMRKMIELEFSKDKIRHYVIHGDCRKILPLLPNDFVDLILTDPPFNISQETTLNMDNRKYSLDFGQWDKNEIFPEDWIPLALPILKEESGVLITFTGKRLAERTMQVIEKEGSYIRNIGVWISPIYVPMFRSDVWSSASMCFVIATRQKGNKHHFNNLLKEHPDYIIAPHATGSERKRYNHPTLKPRKVIRELMEYWSFPGDIVLDPFAGMFTTNVVAESLGRNSIAIEKDLAYYKLGLKRLKEEVKKGKLFINPGEVREIKC